MDDASIVKESSDAEGSQYLTFKLGDEIYGISVDHVKEVNEFSNVYVIPRVPAFIKGVINLRGEVVPVIDLSQRLYGRPIEISKLTCIAVLELKDEDERVPIGIVIDAVKEVVEIRDDKIEATPEFSLNIRDDFVSGVGKVRDTFIVLLNVETVLNIHELSQIGGADEDRVRIAL